MTPKPRPIDSGWCQSGNHRRCSHHLQAAGGSKPDLWCGCDCHDEKAHPMPDQLAATLEELEHRAGQLWHVDVPDLFDQADDLDEHALRFALTRLRQIIIELSDAALRISLGIAAQRAGQDGLL